MQEITIGSNGEQKEEKGDKVNQESLAIAADYLGYAQDMTKWSPELIAKKKAMMQEQAEFMRTFSDESRMEILIFLMHSGSRDGELLSYTVSEIAERFNISMSTVSHHLQELKRAGIVRMERRGKERYYQFDLDYVIERFGVLYKRLLTKREKIRRGLNTCPLDVALDAFKKAYSRDADGATPEVSH